jgi:hypothetical protein
MKIIATVLIFILLVIGGCNDGGGGGDGGAGGDDHVPGAGAEDYTAQDYEPDFKSWEQDQSQYADADKTGRGDSNLCWAAVAANMITWVGWAADENDTFEIFKDHFNDQAGYVYDALHYYFADYVPDVSADTVSVRETRSHKLLDFIVSALHEGKGVGVKIARSGKNIGHFLSIYGYRYLAEEDNFILYFTDSDDGSYRMRQFHAGWKDDTDRWEFQYPYTGYYLEYAIALARK